MGSPGARVGSACINVWEMKEIGHWEEEEEKDGVGDVNNDGWEGPAFGMAIGM